MTALQKHKQRLMLLVNKEPPCNMQKSEMHLKAAQCYCNIYMMYVPIFMYKSACFNLSEMGYGFLL